jgi:hypothetical protein
MITAAEYRAWAEESLKWAGEATTANERDAYVKIAEIWLQSALRSERLSKSRHQQPNTSGCCPRFGNGGASALIGMESETESLQITLRHIQAADVLLGIAADTD